MTGLGTTQAVIFAALAVAAPSFAVEVPVQPDHPAPATSASSLLDAVRRAPERSILESVVTGSGGKTTFRLFSNGLAILATTNLDGSVLREHRLLQPEELAVYVARVDALLAPDPESGSTNVAEGELLRTFTIVAGSSEGKRFSWRFTSLDSPPLVAGSLRALAADLEQTVRDRQKVDDPWKAGPPPDGESLRRTDGQLWVVLRYDDTVDAVELESQNGEQHTKIPRGLLHTLFLREVEERALDAPPAAATTSPSP